MKRLLQLGALACLAIGQTNQVLYKQVFTARTTPQTVNVAITQQTNHTVTVIFPGESNAVTGLSIHIEAAFSATGPWMSVSDTLTQATAHGALVYDSVTATGAWPYIRVVSANSTGGKLMDGWYSGTAGGLGGGVGVATAASWGAITGTLANQIDLKAALDAKQAAITTGTTSQYLRGDLSLATFPAIPPSTDKMTMLFCAPAACAVGATLDLPYLVTATRSIQRCYIRAKVAPATTDLIVQVNKNGTSAFTVTLTHDTYYATSTPSLSLAEGDYLDAVITQIGTTTAGQFVSLVCTLQ